MQHDFTVIGVMPHGFNFPDESDLWIPDYNFIISPWGQARTAHNFRSLALLKPGVSVASAQSEMKAIGARLAKEYPADDLPKSVAVTPLHDELVKRVRTTLYLLLGAVALVLLIACANVANLLLAKLAARKQEMAVRTALGASRSNLIRQLLLESLVLAVPAGLLGLLLGWWGGHALVLIAPPNLITKTDVPFDWHVALFAVAASLVCIVLFGLAPALQSSTDDLHSALYAGGSYSVLRGGMGRLRSGIVIGEIAISMALLAGATVLVRSLIALNSVDPGYRAQGLWSMNADFPASNEEDAHHAVQFYLTLIDQARELPGMQDVAATNGLPNEDTSNGTFDIEGRPGPAAGDYISQDAGFIIVSPGYFRVLGIPVLSGRDFNDQDTERGRYTCIINHALVEKFFPDRDPVGQRIKDGYDSADKYMTIVGVVGDVRQESVDLPPIPFIYHPYLQHPLPATSMHILYRSNGENADALRATARRLNPEVAVAFQPLAEVFERTFAPSRFRSTVLGLFAGLALLLALAGVYGVTSYMVTQRRSEIGMRMALGARPLQIASLILRQGLGLVLAGVLTGATITMVGARVFTSVVYGVKVSEPLVLLLIAAVQTLVAALAIYIPARRAAQVDPMLALRSE
jgi:predicted permease